MSHEIVEKKVGLMGALIALVITVGGLVEIVPLYAQQSVIEPSPGIKPYSPLALEGRDVYVERRVADITKGQTRQSSKATLLQIVRQGRRNIRHEFGRRGDVIANRSYAQLRSQLCAHGCFNLGQRSRFAGAFAGQPPHLQTGGFPLVREFDQSRIESSKSNELGRFCHTGKKRLRAADCGHRARRADRHQDFVGGQHTKPQAGSISVSPR